MKKIINWAKLNKRKLEDIFIWTFPATLVYLIICFISKPYGGEVNYFNFVLAFCVLGSTLLVKILINRDI